MRRLTGLAQIGGTYITHSRTPLPYSSVDNGTLFMGDSEEKGKHWDKHKKNAGCSPNQREKVFRLRDVWCANCRRSTDYERHFTASYR